MLQGAPSPTSVNPEYLVDTQVTLERKELLDPIFDESDTGHFEVVGGDSPGKCIVRIYVNMYMHVYVYVCVYVCICKYVYNNVCSLAGMVAPTTLGTVVFTSRQRMSPSRCASTL